MKEKENLSVLNVTTVFLIMQIIADTIHTSDPERGHFVFEG